MQTDSSPSLVLHVPTAQRLPAMSFPQRQNKSHNYYYDPKSGRWYQLPQRQPAQNTDTDQLEAAGEGHSFWAIMKEAFLIVLLVGTAIGIAVGCVCLLGFEESVLHIAEGIVSWCISFKQLLW